jgi:hypothetical protein
LGRLGWLIVAAGTISSASHCLVQEPGLQPVFWAKNGHFRPKLAFLGAAKDDLGLEKDGLGPGKDDLGPAKDGLGAAKDGLGA